MTLRGRLWRAAVCLTALLLVSCASQAPATQAPAPTTPNQTTGTQESAGIMSSFSTTDLEGNPVDESLLAQYDLTMVNVWTTYCGYCLKEMPDPVSYTHLDVYKRQGPGVCQGAIPRCWNSAGRGGHRLGYRG